MPACGYKPGALSFWPDHSFQDLQVLQLRQSVHAPLPSCKLCKGLELSTACPSIALINEQASLRPSLAFARGQRMFNLFCWGRVWSACYNLVAGTSKCLTCDVKASVFLFCAFHGLPWLKAAQSHSAARDASRATYLRECTLFLKQ